MAAIISVSLNQDEINKLTEGKGLYKGKKATYINLTINVNDDNDAYGQNVSVTVNQSQEDRAGKVPKIYVGNGKVVWSKGDVKTAKSLEGSSSESQASEWE